MPSERAPSCIPGDLSGTVEAANRPSPRGTMVAAALPSARTVTRALQAHRFRMVMS